MGIREALALLVAGKGLPADDMAAVVGQIMDGQTTPAQVGALLAAMRMKGETVDEAVGAARAMRQRMVRVQADDPVLLDNCGTGGDASGSVNISTLAAFVLAACGVKVAKHGNRALSSRSGSHDVLEALGIDPAPGPDLARRCLAEIGICFMFAPAYHAATKNVAGPRREVGFRTLFNLLGPMTNPAGARYHVNGVFAAERCEFLAQAHGRLGSERAMVVHGAGGLDEFAPAGKTLVSELDKGKVRSYEVAPADFGLPEADAAGLRGGEPAQNAAVLLATLRGEAGASRVSTVMTAAAGLVVVGKAASWREAAAMATQALDSGAAMSVLERVRGAAGRA
ncbi:MAG: anthranilate phosphoribosyltransferase [Deltaproteobacteria bacterium]|nr:anthranilate phosphoribosyltransferase [Deltaproteobacteria bacterium]